MIKTTTIELNTTTELNNLLLYLVPRMQEKYQRGAEHHRARRGEDSILNKTPLELVDECIDEAIDQLFYLAVCRRKLTDTVAKKEITL
jgi:hypothetical protein